MPVEAGNDRQDACVRVCLMLEGQEGVGWDQWVALAQACERHGLEGLFRSDHYLSLLVDESRGSLDAWTTLAGLAVLTRRIRLGTMVSPATFRHPSVLAKVATTVDHISGGRVELGLGAGWNEREHRAYGFDFPPVAERMELLAEQLELIHRQWTEDEVDFSGRHYRTERLGALPRPMQGPRPRLLVGGSALPGTVTPAVRFADEYNTIAVPAEEVAARRERLDEACRRQGRDPETLSLSLMTGCVLGRDQAEVNERVRLVMERMGRAGDSKGFVRERADRWVLGTVEQARERLDAYADAGVERILLQHLDHSDLDAVALMGELG
jgi:F420-dependent oxidoreductase-like protein